MSLTISQMFITLYKSDIESSVEDGIRKKSHSMQAMLKALDGYDDIHYFDYNDMDNAIIISDLHIGHTKVIEYSDRPFDSIDVMNDTIMTNIESSVSPDTHLIVVGDVAMKQGIEPANEFFSSLKCKKYLVFGNHDLYGTGDLRIEGFDVVTPMMFMNGPGEPPHLVFTHYPLLYLKADSAFNVHGHIHERPAPTSWHVNVSVEQIDYKPVSLVDIYNLSRLECGQKQRIESQELTEYRILNAS